MDDFSLWTEAGRDAEAEAADVRLTRAKVAAAGIWPFLAIAESEAEFDHRLALADEALLRAVEGSMVVPVKVALKDDFRAMRGITAANDAEVSQYVNEKANGYTDTRDGFAPGIGSYGPHDPPASFHQDAHHVYDSLGSAKNHLGAPRPGEGRPALAGYNHCDSCDHVYNNQHPDSGDGAGHDVCLNCGDTGFHENAADVLHDSGLHDRDHGDEPHSEDNYGDPYGRHDNPRQGSRTANGTGGHWDNLAPQHQINSDVRGGAHNTVAPTAAAHSGHAQGDPCTSACFTPRDGKEARRVIAGEHGTYRSRHADDPDGQVFNVAAPEHQKALKARFDGSAGPIVHHPSEPNTLIHDVDNFWDGPKHVKHNGDGTYTWDNHYGGGQETFGSDGHTIKGGPPVMTDKERSEFNVSSTGSLQSQAAFWHEWRKPDGTTYMSKADGLTPGEQERAKSHPDFVREFQGNQFGEPYGKEGSKTAEAFPGAAKPFGSKDDEPEGESENEKKEGTLIFHAGLQQWVRLADVNRAGPPGDGQLEAGPNTGQTGFPPVATDPMNPINQMFPMQPTGWGQPQLPQELNAATGQPVQYGTTGSRLPFALAGENPFEESNPFTSDENPFAGGSGFAEQGGGLTPQTTPPRQIPGGGSGGAEMGAQPPGAPSAGDTSNVPSGSEDKPVTAGVVRERPTNDNPNGIADEYVSNNYDAPLKMAPRQAPEERGVNSPTVPDDKISEMSSDIPRPGDSEESEAEEKQARVKQGFSARQDGPTMAFPIICQACKRTGSVARVTASLRCVCGSQDLDLWDGQPVEAPATLASFSAFMTEALVDPAQGPNTMSNGMTGPRPCPACHGTGNSMEAGGICRYCGGAGKVQPYGSQEPAPAVAKHYNEGNGKTAAPRGKRPKQNGEFDVEQHIRDTTRGYGGRAAENETVRPSTKRDEHSMGVSPAYRPHFDYDAHQPKKPFETGHRCPGCGHGVTYLTPDYKGDSWLTCPKEGPLINVDRGAGTTFDPESPPADWAPSSRSFKAPDADKKTAQKKPKALQIAESVASTNPGMTFFAAYRIAQRTVARFPGVTAR